MSRRITEVTRGSLAGHGPNKTTAKADLEERIDKALDGSYTPRLIRVHGQTALVWRELDGWSYRIISLVRVNSDHAGYLHGNGGHAKSLAEAERQARFHLAQVVFQIGGPTGLSAIQNADDRREHTSWCEFQYAYTAWRATRIGDTKAHREAAHRRWPEGVEPVHIASLPE